MAEAASPASATHRHTPAWIALVDDELADLPRLDDRYRLWPWPLSAVARRCGRARSTVHKHVRTLHDAGVLVTEHERWPGRTVVDTVRLAELRSGGGRVPRRGRCARPDGSGGVPDAVERRSTAEELVAALDSLTVVLEARGKLSEALGPVVARLAQVLAVELASGSPARTRSATAAARPAAAVAARDRATEARKCALGSEERKRDHTSSELGEQLSDSLSSTSNDLRDRAPEHGAQARSDGARSRSRLLELLASLDPRRHVTYLEGVEAALAGYTDAQIAHAVSRIASLGAVATSPIGLLVDRAVARDSLFFPPSGLAGRWRWRGGG